MNRIAAAAMVLIVGCSFASCTLLRSVTGRKKKNVDTALLTVVRDTSYKVVVPTPDTSKKAADTSVALKQMINEATPYWTKRVAYKSFSGKAKMHFEGPDQKQEFTAHIRVRKDSVIWITVTAMSGVVQAARIFITPDSFYMVNYLDKEATVLSLDQVAKVLPTKVDFSSLQNFIIGDPMREGDIMSVQYAGDTLHMDVEDSAYVQHIVYSRKDSSMTAADMTTAMPGGPEATTHYSGYAVIDNRKISTVRTLHLQKGSTVFSLDMNFMKIDFDQPQEYRFSIPDSYTIKH